MKNARTHRIHQLLATAIVSAAALASVGTASATAAAVPPPTSPCLQSLTRCVLGGVRPLPVSVPVLRDPILQCDATCGVPERRR